MSSAMIDSPWKRILNPRLGLRIQVILGMLFILSAMPKLMDPPAFAKAVWHYKLLPLWAVNPMALILPWLELVCGLALVCGLWIRAAAHWIILLLGTFILALSINLARHRPVDCGCFSLNEPPKTESQRLQDMRWAILRDFGMLLLAFQILGSARQRQNP